MTARSLFDDMLDAWDRARKADADPARWRVNYAAWRELLKDERVYFQQAPPRDTTAMQLLGAPVSIIDDRQTIPSFYLHTDSRP